MKILVAYRTVTGNTKKIAEAVFGELKEEKELKEIKNVKELRGYGLIFLGFPILDMGPDRLTRDFLEQKCRGKKIALFITHGSSESSPNLKEWLDKFREAAAESELIGMFNCQGELSENITRVFSKSENPILRELGKTRNATLGQPDKSRIEKARVFAREVMKNLSQKTAGC